jgi:hypothetical protein
MALTCGQNQGSITKKLFPARRHLGGSGYTKPTNKKKTFNPPVPSSPFALTASNLVKRDPTPVVPSPTYKATKTKKKKKKKQKKKPNTKTKPKKNILFQVNSVHDHAQPPLHLTSPVAVSPFLLNMGG